MLKNMWQYLANSDCVGGHDIANEFSFILLMLVQTNLGEDR